MICECQTMFVKTRILHLDGRIIWHTYSQWALIWSEIYKLSFGLFLKTVQFPSAAMWRLSRCNMETTQAPNFFDKCMKSLVSNQIFRKITTMGIRKKENFQIRFQQDIVFIAELFFHLRFELQFEV